MSDGTDHWNPGSGMAPSISVLAAALNVDDIQDIDWLDDTRDQSTLTSVAGVKRLGKFIHDKIKKPKTAQVTQEQIAKISDIAEKSHTTIQSFINNDDTTYVTSVMNEVIACGMIEGTNEHFIATELFMKRKQKQMFMHMSVEARKGCLRMKYNIKYGNQLVPFYQCTMVAYALCYQKLFACMHCWAIFAIWLVMTIWIIYIYVCIVAIWSFVLTIFVYDANFCLITC